MRKLSFDEQVIPEPNTGCHLWIGTLNEKGYGRMSYNRSAHRTAWEMAHGRPIPKGMHIDHLCRVRSCVNPAHLECVTPNENWRRSLAVTNINRLKTECVNGHTYDGHNTAVLRNGRWRVCRKCRAANTKRWRGRVKK